MAILIESGAGLRRGILGAVLLPLLCACATEPAYQQARQDRGDYRSSHWSAAGLHVDSIAENRAEAFFAKLTGETPSSFRLEESIVSRINIGGVGRSEISDHELSAPGPLSSEKAENKLAGGSVDALLRNAQNSVLDNGWRKGEDGYLHLPSGFVCPETLNMVLNNEDEDSTTTLALTINNIRMFNDVSTDTACDYVSQDSGAYITVFASKWPDTTLEDHYGAALQHIVDRFAVASEASLLIPTIELFSDREYQSTVEAETLSGAFLLEPQDGVTVKTALWLNKTGDWHIKARATYVLDMQAGEPQLMPAELMATVFHAATLYAVDYHINTNNGVDVSY